MILWAEIFKSSPFFLLFYNSFFFFGNFLHDPDARNWLYGIDISLLLCPLFTLFFLYPWFHNSLYLPVVSNLILWAVILKFGTSLIFFVGILVAVVSTCSTLCGCDFLGYFLDDTSVRYVEIVNRITLKSLLIYLLYECNNAKNYWFILLRALFW